MTKQFGERQSMLDEIERLKSRLSQATAALTNAAEFMDIIKEAGPKFLELLHETQRERMVRALLDIAKALEGK